MSKQIFTKLFIIISLLLLTIIATYSLTKQSIESKQVDQKPNGFIERIDYKDGTYCYQSDTYRECWKDGKLLNKDITKK
jgi:hypothetical protein